MVKTATGRKATSAPESADSAKARKRRTPEQMIADKQAEIAAIEARAARQSARQTPDGKAFVAARRAIKACLKAANEADNEPMQAALEDAHGAVERFAVENGLAAGPRRAKAG